MILKRKDPHTMMILKIKDFCVGVDSKVGAELALIAPVVNTPTPRQYNALQYHLMYANVMCSNVLKPNVYYAMPRSIYTKLRIVRACEI